MNSFGACASDFFKDDPLDAFQPFGLRRSHKRRWFEEEVQKIRQDMLERRKRFWKRVQKVETDIKDEEESWLKKTNKLFEDVINYSQKPLPTKTETTDKNKFNKSATLPAQKTYKSCIEIPSNPIVSISEEDTEVDIEGEFLLERLKRCLSSETSEDTTNKALQMVSEYIEKKKELHRKLQELESKSNQKSETKAVDISSVPMRRPRSSEKSLMLMNGRDAQTQMRKDIMRHSVCLGEDLFGSSSSSQANGKSGPSTGPADVTMSCSVEGGQRNFEMSAKQEKRSDDGKSFTIRKISKRISIPVEMDFDSFSSSIPREWKDMLARKPIVTDVTDTDTCSSPAPEYIVTCPD